MPHINAGPWPEEEFDDMRKAKGYKTWEQFIEDALDVDFSRFSE